MIASDDQMSTKWYSDKINVLSNGLKKLQPKSKAQELKESLKSGL